MSPRTWQDVLSASVPYYWGSESTNLEGTSEVIYFHLPILQMSLECSRELNWLDQSLETEPDLLPRPPDK